MKLGVRKKAMVWATSFLLLLIGLFSIQIYVTKKILPEDWFYDTFYFVSIAETYLGKQPSQLSDLTEAYEIVCSEWENNPHEQTYDYMKKYSCLIYCFVREDSFYYIDLLSGHYCVISL